MEGPMKTLTWIVMAATTALAAACTDRGGAMGDDDDDGADAGSDVTEACVLAMQDAPTGAAATPYTDILPIAQRNTWDAQSMPSSSDPMYPGGKYRTIDPDSQGKRHPGCSTDGLSYTPASIAGYPCAAIEFPFPAGASEDTSKPIVLLIHGNSDVPRSWQAFVHENPDSLEFPADQAARDQLAELLPAAGYRTIAVDLRFDLVDDPPDPSSDPGSPIGNTSKNMDHGWATPIAQELIRDVIDANPGRKVSLVGLSLGVTVARDALRRLYVDYREGSWDKNPFEHVQDVVLGSGANHGVSSNAALCGSNHTMRGTVTCEMGQRNTYTQPNFHKPLNGPAMPTDGGEFGGWYETPCADGDYAFGERGACGGHAVEYTTIAMADLQDGTQQDLFISEHSGRLYPPECVDNHVNGLFDFDTSGYFLNGLFRNHYGSVRSIAGLAVIQAVLAD
jgi:hypothetical protein